MRRYVDEFDNGFVNIQKRVMCMSFTMVLYELPNARNVDECDNGFVNIQMRAM